MSKKSIFFLFLCVCLRLNAWWATPHMLVADIAYQQCSAKERQELDELIAIHAKQYPKTPDFVSAAVWADDIKSEDPQYNNWHYVTLTFSEPEDPLPTVDDFPPQYQVAWAIERDTAIYHDRKQPKSERALALRRLIHWVGDIHQPLHAVSHVSPDYPDGDMGGNLFKLHKDAPANNLHSLWDGGVELWPYIPRPLNTTDKARIRAESQLLMQMYGMNVPRTMNPQDWALESHQLARNTAYSDIDYKGLPSEDYTTRGARVARERVVIAGMRLRELVCQ